MARVCRNGCFADTLVLSHLPLEDPEVHPGLGKGVLTVRVLGPAPFTLLATHLSRPALDAGAADLVTFGHHHGEVRALLALADRQEGPVVIAGDLNTSDRTRAYRELDDELVDAVRTGRWAGTTFFARPFRVLALRIDHVFVSPGWCADGGGTLAVAGSDHHAVRSDVGPCG
jgi:endonuclease/exonuclease/phosphatase (EEP) superfamily protein YafD